MNDFSPIAIIGEGCILPGASTPDELWQTLIKQQVHLHPVPAPYWRLDKHKILNPANHQLADFTCTDYSGLVTGFDPTNYSQHYALDNELVAALDPLFQWSLAAAWQAWQDAGYDQVSKKPIKAGVVLGNLSYPSPSFNKLFEEHYLHQLFPNQYKNKKTTHPMNRFMSGMPALLIKQALNFSGDAFCLDAACASSLYAIKIACDRLQHKRDDVILCGGVNGADSLLLHIGFTALQALSPSGQSRPFNQGADGLIPAEGAAFVVLKRLEDALADQNIIKGVIRGIGLSNDGRSGGFLQPHADGQVRAMNSAFKQSGLHPSEISLMECHATGTGGDAIEAGSLATVFSENKNLVLGSLKANIGHSITASGAAGLIKVLQCMKHDTLVPTPNAYPLLDSLSSSSFVVPTSCEPWHSKSPIPKACVSSFGFGGNNAHLIVEKWTGQQSQFACPSKPASSGVAVIGLAVRTNKIKNNGAFLDYLLTNQLSDQEGLDDIKFSSKDLMFPPKDMQKCLGQQLLMLYLVKEALTTSGQVESASTGVYIGTGVDAEVNRYALNFRLEELLSQQKIMKDRGWLEAMKKKIISNFMPADVIGTMPNIPANRINNHYNFLGPGFTISCEELSGDQALKLAMHAIRTNEIKSAIVGAVDFSLEPVHQEALRQMQPSDENQVGADGGVVLVLKDYQAACADRDHILAVLEEKSVGEPNVRLGHGYQNNWISADLGQAHAAAGLLHVGAAVLLAHQRFAPASLDQSAKPLVHLFKPLQVEVINHAFSGMISKHRIRSEKKSKDVMTTLKSIPEIYTYAAPTQQQLLNRLTEDHRGEDGSYRLAFAALPHKKSAIMSQAIEFLKKDQLHEGWHPKGFAYRSAPIKGELAFVYTGSAAAYADMGKALLFNFPHLVEGVTNRLHDREQRVNWIYDQHKKLSPTPFNQLIGSSFLCQLHTELSRQVFNLVPDVAIGLSSGETNALFALDGWSDMDGLIQGIEDSGLYSEKLGGHFQSIAAHWEQPQGSKINWENWRLFVPVAEVKLALLHEKQVYLTIIYHDHDCQLGGEANACKRIIEKIAKGKATFLDNTFAVHCPPVKPFAPIWYQLHDRETKKPSAIKFYSNYFEGPYPVNHENVAEALTGQALQTLDWPKLINKAWDNGVRIFIEHGPRNSLSMAIDKILQGKNHLAVAWDDQTNPNINQIFKTACQLWCAGQPIAIDNLNQGQPNQSSAKGGAQLSFSLHKPKITLPGVEAKPREVSREDNKQNHQLIKILPQPPALASILSSEVDLIEEQLNPVIGQTKVNHLKQTIRAEEKVNINSLTTIGATGDHTQVLLNLHQQLVKQHQLYLDQQVEAHQATMSLLSQTWSTLTSHQPIKPLPQLSTLSLESKVAKPIKKEVKPGPCFSREELEQLASGKISDLFGPLFKQQDDYAIQVRMPEPPLLLCDRVTGIQGEPGSQGKGIIWTETDIKPDSWYLHHGRMPAGLFIESGQADLLLVSWLGADFLNQGQRAYRLLGCELVYHGSLPKPGDTLKYEIHIDGYANQGEVRLFFFHYDCWINNECRISVRHGQAGFFTDQELHESGGVLWSPESGTYQPDAQLALPDHHTKKKSFTLAEVEQYTLGNMVACFGEQLYWTQTHTRTPVSQGDWQNLIGEITTFDVKGGPQGRGYLKSVNQIQPDDWYFSGHFKNDPCMPGTLMAEGCLQLMTFYMVGIGLTSDKDGWRFEPVAEEKYKFICRGQVVPSSKTLTYEIIVDEIIAKPYPILYAHLLCTVDGTKAFLCERMGLQLVPDWPLTSVVTESNVQKNNQTIAAYEGFKFTYAALLNSALGQPSLAFGEKFRAYDQGVRSPRLPGPPYHFMSRIVDIQADFGHAQDLPQVVADYDIPTDAWYFQATGSKTMPFCVLMEIALQPCGWLSTFTQNRAVIGHERVFRNLDGTAVQYRAITPDDQTITTKATLTAASSTAEISIVKFTVRCTSGDELVFETKTVFGFFSPQSMVEQKGLAITKQEQAQLNQPGTILIDLTNSDHAYFNQGLVSLPSANLLMLDRITGYQERGGRAELGWLRAEKTVKASDWFFKAHFYQDPVQPGSLGIEAMIQLMQYYMLTNNLQAGLINPVFEPIVLNQETEWHYRGQVTPDKKMISIDMEILEIEKNDLGVTILTEARLWVDGLKIYHVPRIGLRIKEHDQVLAKEKREPKINDEQVLTISESFLKTYHLVGTKSSNEKMLAISEDIQKALINKFVRRLVWEDKPGFDSLKGQPAIFLANHQTGIESFLFLALMQWIQELEINAIAKKEHQQSYFGLMDAMAKLVIGEHLPLGLLYIDRDDPQNILAILNQLAKQLVRQPQSLLVHVEGTRARQAGQQVSKISSILPDFALEHQLPIIPVKFAGGLAQVAGKHKLEFPVGYGQQDYYIGKAILPAELQRLNLKERNDKIVSSINNLGPTSNDDMPLLSDEKFSQKLNEFTDKHHLPLHNAVIYTALRRFGQCHAMTLDFIHEFESANFDPNKFSKKSLDYSVATFLSGH